MLLQDNKKLEDLVIDLLSKKPRLSAKSIHELIIKNNKSYTLRAVYKELNKLVDEAIIAKDKNYFSLRYDWLIKAKTFLDEAYKVYSSKSELESIVNSNQKTVRHFYNLKSLDRFWTQLIMALYEIYKDEPMFFYCPYQWFHLINAEYLDSFFEVLEKNNKLRYHIIGSDTYLERLALKTLPKSGVYSFAESDFHSKRDTYICMIKNSIITIKVDLKTSTKIESVLTRVKEKKDIDYIELLKLSNLPCNAKLTLTEDVKKSNKLRKAFNNYFGL